MRNILAIVERELRAYFISPIAYVVLTAFLLLSGIVFQGILTQVMDYQMRSSLQSAQLGRATPIDGPAIISQQFLGTMSVLLLFMIPMVTMGLFAEEKRRGTIELLLTAPMTDLQVVLGKFFSAVAFFLILLMASWLPMSVLYLYGSPASGPIFSNYLGIVLYGFALVGIGLFVSTLTENQIISGILGFVIALAMWFFDLLAARAEQPTKAIMEYLSVISHLQDFMKGVIVTSNIIFYLSLTILTLFLTYRSIDSLRWRG
ncbi:MAG: ABC transporter [Acidobacteria bacterium]|nr:MAG: ABC transporter [Acidobacteriota bacterium]